MTAVAPSRPGPPGSPVRAAAAAAPSAARLLRIEIKRNAVIWVLPLLAALFVFDPYRTASGYPPIWTVHGSVVLNKMLPDFVILTSGMAAWAGTREGRRRVDDLLGTTARPAWARQAAALGGTLFWVLLAFLAGVAVIYVRTAALVTWGGPPVWPIVVGVVAMVTVCTVSFTAGALFPGRFTAPIVAVGVTVLTLYGFRQAVSGGAGLTLLSPDTVVPPDDAGVFYHVAPDVAIAQVLFMGGVALAAFGVLGLSPRTGGVGFRRAPNLVSGSGPHLRTVATAGLAVGAAAAVISAVLTGTATQTASGYNISGLHWLADDQPVPYTPECTQAGFRVCVHPAFGTYLSDVSGALDPVAAELAGLPGAPASAAQVPLSSVPNSVLGNLGNGFIIGTGTTTEYEFTLDNAVSLYADKSNIVWTLQQDLVNVFVAGTPAMSGSSRVLGAGPPAPDGLGVGTPAQQAVESALLRAIGAAPPQQGPAGSGQPEKAQAAITQAAGRFAALPATTRHAWLLAHLTALRAGHVTLAQLP
jgi:hypothetical protein